MTEREWLASAVPSRMLDFLFVDSGAVRYERGLPVRSEMRSDRKMLLFACACRRLLSQYRWEDGNGWNEMEKDGQITWRSTSKMAKKDAYLFLEDIRIAERNAEAADRLRDIVSNPFVQVVFPIIYVQDCPSGCAVGGKGHISTGETVCGACGTPWKKSSPWFTPEVVAIAQSAYEEQVGSVCQSCYGRGRLPLCADLSHRPGCDCQGTEECLNCRGHGRISEGALDSGLLAILADALEDAGCPAEVCQDCWGAGCYERDDGETIMRGPCHCTRKPSRRKVPHPFLEHLRGPGPHVRGCWVLDFALSKR